MYKVFLTAIFSMIIVIGVSQNVIESSGTVAFPTIADYEFFAEKADDREPIKLLIDNSTTIQPWVSSIKNNDPEVEEEEIVPEFLQLILNKDNIVSIGTFFVKIDFANNRTLVIQSIRRNAYSDLVNNNLQADSLLQFTMDDGNIIEIMEEIETGKASNLSYRSKIIKIDEIQSQESLLARGPSENVFTEVLYSCPNPGPRDEKRNQAWGIQYAASACTSPGNNNATNSGDLKLVYQKAGVYFSLIAKEKCRRVCVYGGNPFTSPTISLEMYLNGTVTFRRCGGNQQTGNRLSGYTFTNEKSWRPYEGSRRLASYSFSVNFKQRDCRSGVFDFGFITIAN